MVSAERAEPIGEVYPGAPLSAVAIETRFGPLLDAHARFGAFQRAHADEFDQLIFTDEGEQRGPVLSRLRGAVLFSKRTSRAVAVAADQLAVVTYDYGQGFAGFTSWAVPLLQEGLGILDVRRLTRVRYRYENVVATNGDNDGEDEDAEDEEKDVDLEPTFRLQLPRGVGALPTLRNVHLFWKQVWLTGTVDVALDACSDLTDPGKADLTISGQCDDAIATVELEEKIREAHRIARLTFEALITPEYRERLRRSGRA